MPRPRTGISLSGFDRFLRGRGLEGILGDCAIVADPFLTRKGSGLRMARREFARNPPPPDSFARRNSGQKLYARFSEISGSVTLSSLATGCKTSRNDGGPKINIRSRILGAWDFESPLSFLANHYLNIEAALSLSLL